MSARLQAIAVQALLVLPALVFWPGARDAFLVPPQALAAVLAAAGFSAWIAGSRPGWATAPRGWRVLAVGWLGWLGLRIVGSADPWLGAVRVHEWLVVALAACAGLGLADRDRRRAADALAAGATLVAAIAIVEWALGRFPLLPDAVPTTAMPGRPGSTLGNPVFLGSWLAAVLPVVIAGGSRWHRAAGLLMTMALVLTGSRGALVAAVCGAGWVAFRDPAVRGRVVRSAVAAGIGLVALAGSGAATARHLLNPDWAGRAEVWRTAGRLVRTAPLPGVGTGGFGAAYPCARLGAVAESGTSAWWPTLHAHNDYLHALAETGPVGLLVLLGWIVAMLRARPPDAPGWGAQGGVVALAVAALTAFPLHLPPTQLLWWMLPAVWMTAAPAERPGRSRWPAILAGAVLVVLPAWGAARLLVRNAQVQAGLGLVRDGAFAPADGRFAAALRLFPDTARDRIVMQRAIGRFAAGELGEAEALLAGDDRRYPCTAEATWYRAFIAVMRVAAGQREVADAAELRITDGLGYGPPPVRASGFWTLRGHLRFSRGDRRGAADAYRTALELDPANRDARRNLDRLGAAGIGPAPIRR